MTTTIYSWQPGGPDTEVEQLRSEIARLRRKVERLEKGALDTHWRINPDRSGGVFTQEEIKNAKAW